jgi:hypothetical protein
MRSPAKFRLKARGYLLGLGVAASLLAAAVCYYSARQRPTYDLRLFIGQDLRFTPAAIAALVEEAEKQGLTIDA